MRVPGIGLRQNFDVSSGIFGFMYFEYSCCFSVRMATSYELPMNLIFTPCSNTSTQHSE